MKIEHLKGGSKRLYDLVAPLCMDPAVIRQNGGAAFKTGSSYEWIISISGKNVIGFAPIQYKSTYAEINNYHSKGRSKETLKAMIQDALATLNGKVDYLLVITQRCDEEVLKELKFIADKEWKNYIRYRYDFKKDAF